MIIASTRDAMLRPDSTAVASSQLTDFIRFCERETGRAFHDYGDFDGFAVEEFRTFWQLFLRWSGLRFDGSPELVCTDDECERAMFFPDIRLSYVESLLRIDDVEDADRPALTACHADRPADQLTRRELRDQVAAVAVALRSLGVAPGDRVVAMAHNDADAIVAGLATVALGATLSTAAPDMGAFAILSRFRQLEPSVLLTHLREVAAPTSIPLCDRVAEVARELPSLAHIVALDDGPAPEGLSAPLHRLSDLAEGGRADAPAFEWPRFPFNHPLFIMFSSGTTGPPKCIVHGAGGTLLEHLKEHRLHGNLSASDTLYFQTSAAWMMWNWQLSALACGSRIVVYDGPVTEPGTLWRIASDERVTVFGTSPPYLQLCQETGFSPRRELELGSLRAVQSTGSILYDSQYNWLHEHVGPRPAQSISGGTDILGCFVLGNPNLPVYRGESQCRSLGLDVRALPDRDAAPGSKIGELVCCNPFPSRPLGFYGDPHGARFHDAYFSQNPGIWTHGDLIEFTAEGSARLHGRSDGVLNIRGIRIGPAEIYRILEDIPEIREAMAVERRTQDVPGAAQIVLLVVMLEPGTLDGRLGIEIRKELARRASPAHVPAMIVEVDELPSTHSGKRSERAARDAVNETAVANSEALRNPASLDAIRRRLAMADERLSPEPQAAVDLNAPEEDLVRGVWERILGVSPIGPDDDFFDLGGSSLMAVQVIQEISDRLGLDLPMSALFQAPTVAGLAATIRGAEGGFGSRVRANRPPKIRARWKRRMIDLTGRLLAAPIVALHRARLLSFEAGGQLLSLVPGRPGLVVRRGWYRLTLEGCGEISVGFGSMITDPRSRLGDRCSIGPLCNIGWVGIGDDVLIASHVVVLGGGRQHGIADLERPMRSQPGVTERITIGSDVWLGTGATVMADVAPHTIVTAGATVTRSFAPYAVLGGVPAQATGSRLPNDR